jgi:hypothetical protein
MPVIKASLCLRVFKLWATSALGSAASSSCSVITESKKDGERDLFGLECLRCRMSFSVRPWPVDKMVSPFPHNTLASPAADWSRQQLLPLLPHPSFLVSLDTACIHLAVLKVHTTVLFDLASCKCLYFVETTTCTELVIAKSNQYHFAASSPFQLST